MPLSYFTNVDLRHRPRARSRAPAATSRWGTTSTGPPRCATASSAPATPGPTWPSWARTPCTGGSGWSRATGAGPAGRRLPALRAPRPAARARGRRGHGAVPRAARAAPRARPARDAVRVLPRRHRLRRRLARAGGGSAARASPRRPRPRPGRSRGRPGLPGRPLPRPLQILSHSPYSCRGVDHSTQSVYYTTPPGRGLHRRHAALGLRAGRPVRAPAGRAHAASSSRT